MEPSSLGRILHHQCQNGHRIGRLKSTSSALGRVIHQKTCPVCLEHIDGRRAAVLPTCLHSYCIRCIREWSNLKRKCPLCNAPFNSWFSDINLFRRTFHEHKFLPLSEGRNLTSPGVHGRPGNHLISRRVIAESREEFNDVRRRRRPMTRRRTFGKPGSVPSNVIRERILQWRASRYERGLRAIPQPSRSYLQLSLAEECCLGKNLMQRIEPWIHRELQAILGDADPSVIVHVVTTVFILSIEDKHEVPSENPNLDRKYLDPLRPFLHGWRTMFWHELRCFAESSLNMDTYDSFVEYETLGQSTGEGLLGALCI